jgi:hypothetical protein
MRKLLWLVIAGFLLSFGHQAFGQLNRKTIKKNNRRIGNYRGRKSHFGKDKIYNAVGFSVNALNYYGDIAPKPDKVSTDITFTKPGLGISFSHRFGPRYTFTGSFTYGTIKGSDKESADPNDPDNGIYRYQRNLSFRNRIAELSAIAYLDLFENMSTYISRVRWTPYAFLGISVFHHNPQAQVPATEVDNVTPLPNAGEWINLRDLGTEGQYAQLDDRMVNNGIKPYKLIQPAIPFGLGMRLRVTELIDFSAEWGFRYLFTDYIDDVSHNYVDLSVFGNDELAKAMSYRSTTPETIDQLQPSVSIVDGRTYMLLPGYGQEEKDNKRGNPSSKDVMMITTLRVTYILGKTFHRAKFR